MGLNKSFFGFPLIQLLGFKINGFGLFITANRVKTIRKIKILTIFDALKQYIGITKFFRRFIP